MELDMKREDFVKLMYDKVDMDKLYDMFDSYLTQTTDFVFLRSNGEDVSIIFKKLDSEPKIINWYKLAHIGRYLNLWGFRSINELEYILDLLNKNLKEVEL